MALFKQINSKAKANNNTGFGTNPSSYGGRFVNKDGTANIQKQGASFLSRISWYHVMKVMPTWKFILILFGFYIAFNLFFAMLYYAIGLEYVNGIDVYGVTELEKFGKAYFFSAQTFTTVGYGNMSPEGFATSALAATEAMIGLLYFAIATGLFYGRFSRPKAFIKFSHNAVIAPYQDGSALMIRLAPHKNTNLIDAEARMTLGMSIKESGKMVNKFYSLDMEMTKINALTLSWTLVHPITEDSPLFGFTKEDFETTEGEVIVYLNAFDDIFSNTVATGTSYTFDEILYGAKFNIMYTENEDNTKTLLHLDKINSITKVSLH
ncbi:ion channel [Flavobacterium litorale]|uniref:Inward rectifier potassium channel Irk n=1 Tax=Flavobacterium litorale TaxID=2856519 RepID=A0ABX8VAZ0_9FLAO|nr:ion channel [Flavobacterium litorale]QYJ68196.1 Inward rectifier potassium channel Irk [Flavobacterium litorale]